MTMPDPTPRPRRLWLRVLFGVSLALNLLFVGVAVGAWWRFDGAGHRSGAFSVSAAIYRELPKDERRDLWRQLRQQRDTPRGQRRADLGAVVEALVSDPFEPDAVRNILENAQTRRTDQARSMREAWLKKVEAMSAADRAAYAKRLTERMDQHKRKRDK